MNTRLVSAALLCAMLAGCNIPGLPDEEAARVRLEADAKATGSACRHALRGVEDCYGLNPKAPRASVFAGWKDMDTYMRDNKLEGMVPAVQPPKEDVAAADAPEDKGAKPVQKTRVKPAGSSKAPHT